MQTLHKTLHKPHISLIFRTLSNVGFMFQTLHKSYTRTYTNPTQKRSKTIHKALQKTLINYTHPQHFGFEHEVQREHS